MIHVAKNACETIRQRCLFDKKTKLPPKISGNSNCVEKLWPVVKKCAVTVGVPMRKFWGNFTSLIFVIPNMQSTGKHRWIWI